MRDLEIPLLNPDGSEATTVAFEAPYTPEEWRAIAAHLGAPMREFYSDLRIAAIVYTLGDGPSRSRQRAALIKVAQRAENLLKGVITAPEFGVCDDQIMMLEDMAAQATSAANAVPRSGAVPKRARHEFLCELAEIYERTTRKKAARRTNRDTGQAEGPFLEFAAFCLEPLDPVALDGLDPAIRKVLEERRGKRASS